MNSKYISFEGSKLLDASLKVGSAHVDSSFALADDAMKLAKKAKDTVLLGKIQLYYSYLYYWGKGDYIETKQVLDKALEFSDNDCNRQGRIYHNIAWVYADMRLFDKAIK